jgi:hypothetical protein
MYPVNDNLLFRNQYRLLDTSIFFRMLQSSQWNFLSHHFAFDADTAGTGKHVYKFIANLVPIKFIQLRFELVD